jgi:hypothetical protein
MSGETGLVLVGRANDIPSPGGSILHRRTRPPIGISIDPDASGHVFTSLARIFTMPPA